MRRECMLLAALLLLLPSGCRKPGPAAPETDRTPRASEGPSAPETDRPPRASEGPAAPETDRTPRASEGPAAAKPPSGPSRTLDELLDLVSDRRTCNIVMGCDAADDLIAIGAPAVEPIVQRYRTLGRPSYQKFHLIDILGHIRDPAVIPFLEERLADPHWNARANAAIALARLNAVTKLGLIKRLLKKHAHGRDFGFLYALAYAAEKLGASGGRAILLNALTEESVGSINWGYTRVAVVAAGDLGLKQACPDLVHSVLHNDIFLKKDAIAAAVMLECRDEKLTGAIAGQQTSRIPSVRRKAAAALEALGGEK